MKLNVGCGYEKLDGYINIDINPLLKPDYAMPAYNLDFNDSVFNEILAKQVIEHLGFFKTKYFLSEASRTIKKDKFLIIETPHIEKSFENFLNAKNQEDRERVLGWIYGSETEYMNHLYCFPVELMEKLFDEFGFEILKIEYYDYEYMRPSVRYTAIKKKDYEKSNFRKKLVENGVFNLIKNEIHLYEMERIISEISFENIDNFNIFELAFRSPLAAYCVNLIIKKEDDGVLKKLLENNFLGWIFEVMIKYLKDFNDSKKAYEFVSKMFFDNPQSFIYNFIDKKRKSSLNIQIMSYDLFNYELAKRRIK